MATVFTVTNTAGTLNITLQPGQLDGPGGAQRSSDLRLYGLGALLWGEGVDTNLLRITENFACPQKTSGPTAPQDETDVGFVGGGITNPLPGQTWFNTDAGKLFVYDGTAWASTGGVAVDTTPPSSPNQGDLFFDENDQQLKIYITSGSPDAFVSVADRYLLKDGSTPLDAGYSPTNPQDIATKDYVDTGAGGIYVNVTGDTMTGFLTLNADPTAPLHAATKNYVDTEISDLLGGSGSGSPSGGVAVINPGSGNEKDGDIRVDPGPEIFIWGGGMWNKVFPAVFAS